MKATGSGYVLVKGDGGAFAFGGDTVAGSMAGTRLGQPVVSVAVTSTGGGYWELGRDGGVFAFGDAPFKGSGDAYHAYGPSCITAPCGSLTTTLRPAPSAAPAVGIAGTGDNLGYVVAHADGSVFSFGDAYGLYSGLSQTRLAAPVVAIAVDQGGTGAWLVASDGGVFALGDAPFLGSLGGRHLDAPIVGIAADPQGDGYWLVGSDGGVFAFGGAPYSRSLPGQGVRPSHPVVGMAPAADGHGYWLVSSDGGAFALGDAPFEGGAAGHVLEPPVVSVAASSTLDPCEPELSVSTDSAVYPVGAPVTITLDDHNPSHHGCADSVNIGCPVGLSVTGQSGQVVWQGGASPEPVAVACVSSRPKPWRPGRT